MADQNDKVCDSTPCNNESMIPVDNSADVQAGDSQQTAGGVDNSDQQTDDCVDNSGQQTNEVKKNFTEEEVQSFIHMGSRMAAKSVLSVLIETLPKESKKLRREIAKLMPESAGFTQCEFEDQDIKLNICLSKVPRDFVLETTVPSEEYAKDVYQQYGFLKQIALAYWVQWKEQNSALYAQCVSELGEFDLNVDPHLPLTLYFKEDVANRVGLFTYLVDKNGNPFYRK